MLSSWAEGPQTTILTRPHQPLSLKVLRYIKTIFLATSRSPEDHITTPYFRTFQFLEGIGIPQGTAHPHDFPFLHIMGDRGHRAHLVDGEQEIALLRGRGSDL